MAELLNYNYLLYRTITDRSILRLEECETCLASGDVADTSADIAAKSNCSMRALRSPQSNRRTACDAAVSTKVCFGPTHPYRLDITRLFVVCHLLHEC